MAQIKITQTGSRIRQTARQKRTLDALGLRRMNQTVVQNDTPQIRGMVAKVSHLVAVSAADSTAVPKKKKAAKKSAAKSAAKKSAAKKSAAKKSAAKKSAAKKTAAKKTAAKKTAAKKTAAKKTNAKKAAAKKSATKKADAAASGDSD